NGATGAAIARRTAPGFPSIGRSAAARASDDIKGVTAAPTGNERKPGPGKGAGGARRPARDVRLRTGHPPAVPGGVPLGRSTLPAGALARPTIKEVSRK